MIFASWGMRHNNNCPRSIVGASLQGTPAMDLGTGKFNLKLKKKIQPLVEATSYKRQATSNKLDISSGII